MNPILALQGALGALTALFIAGWSAAVVAVRRSPPPTPSPATDVRFPTLTEIGIGAITNFFDTLGIGSFATTTALFRFQRLVPDRIIPGTLNSGHTLPTVVQAFIYTTMVKVDVLTLLALIAAAVLGAYLGAGIVASWSKRRVQIGMGAALLVAATLMLMTQLNLFPGGGEALGVRGIKLLIGVAVNFALGALMSLGIGLYAPCMILISLLGMNPTAAFPDHDGVVRVPHAGRQPALHPRTVLQPARGARPRNRRHSRSSARRLHRHIDPDLRGALAGHRCRRVHSAHDAALSVD
jgi:hypothetical protein